MVEFGSDRREPPSGIRLPWATSKIYYLAGTDRECYNRLQPVLLDFQSAKVKPSGFRPVDV
jgi:hypothetical protein